MLETEHVNKRKQAFTNQYPVGDDVSAYNRCAAARVRTAGDPGIANRRKNGSRARLGIRAPRLQMFYFG